MKEEELDEALGRITVLEEEEQVARQQLEDDIRIYGSRPEPPDAVELDENEHLRNLPPKRNALELKSAVDRPAEIRKKSESKTYNYENITAVDWHAGETPLSAWLNQSAVPAALPIEELRESSSVMKKDELIHQEKKEIEVFKRVHVAHPSEPTNGLELSTGLEHGSGLELDAQIYYRNIMDRFPSLPNYLARRLATGNHARTKRLQQQLRREPSNIFTCDYSNCGAGNPFFARGCELK